MQKMMDDMLAQMMGLDGDKRGRSKKPDEENSEDDESIIRQLSL